jgi:hypothetical protein
MTRRTLEHGSVGEDVRELQRALGAQPYDGEFGAVTDAAVRRFQAAHMLRPDGVVGAQTWAALFPEQAAADAPFSVAEVCRIAREHPAARLDWPGRGQAPIGYVMGTACSLASATMRYRSGYAPAVEVAKQNSGRPLDALQRYLDRYSLLGMRNEFPGENTLRHLWVLMVGLGMRESSGQHTEGRDASASNYSAETAEAGAWQISYDIRATVPGHLFDQLVADASAGACFREVYAQGVSKPMTQNWGSGKGRDFQALCKECPDFAAMVAALGLRHACNHWGPIIRRQAFLAKVVDDLLRQVQGALPARGGLTS